MEYLSLYLIKVNISITAFYFLYFLLFRNEKQFHFNRLFLSSILVMSFLIPLITIKKVMPFEQLIGLPIKENINSHPQKASLSNFDTNSRFVWRNILMSTYVFVGFILSIRLLHGFFKVIQFIHQGAVQTIAGQEVIVVKRDICPFSFFNKIVIPEKLLKSNDLQMIITHEKVHVREKHFIDLLLSEFSLILLWFNPIVWLTNSAVKANLEFSADNATTDLFDIKDYQMAMVRIADPKHISRLANALNVSQLKSRIMMMNRKRQTRYPVLKRLTIVPMLICLILLLPSKEKVEDNEIFYIEGKVTNFDTETPIVWTWVGVKENLPYGAITNNEGVYKIPVDKTIKTLMFSSHGYYRKEIEIKNRKFINVKLKRDYLIEEIINPEYPSD